MKKNNKKAKRVVVGGTFDLFHAGHKALLRQAGEMGQVTIGVTSDNMAFNIKKRKVAQFGERRRNIEDFFEKTFGRKPDIVRIEDKFGQTLEDDFDYIVVSPDTRRTAELINQKRESSEKKPMKIIEIEWVMAEDGQPISSTRINKGEIDQQGKIIKQ